MSKKQLASLENIIENHQSQFYQTGKALKRIRDEKLFAVLLFGSFEAYVKDRWDMSRSKAYRLIEASMVIDNLSPIGNGIFPANEFQARVLSRLKKEDQRKLWLEFISSGITLNARNIRKFINNRSPKKGGAKTCDLTNIISTGYKESVLAMLEQIRQARNDNWKTTSRQAALFWLKIMKEKIAS